MSSDLLQEIACPNCRNPIDIREHGRHITCDACGSQFVLNGHLCPQCHSYHRDEEPFCTSCGAALTRVCRNCTTSNWTGDEYCAQCGEALDIFELLSLQHKDARQKALEQNRRQIRQLRAQEALSAQQRLEELQAIEDERQMHLRQRFAVQRRHDRRLLALSLVGIGIFLMIVIIFVLFTTLQ